MRFQGFHIMENGCKPVWLSGFSNVLYESSNLHMHDAKYVMMVIILLQCWVNHNIAFHFYVTALILLVSLSVCLSMSLPFFHYLNSNENPDNANEY